MKASEINGLIPVLRQGYHINWKWCQNNHWYKLGLLFTGYKPNGILINHIKYDNKSKILKYFGYDWTDAAQAAESTRWSSQHQNICALIHFALLQSIFYLKTTQFNVWCFLILQFILYLEWAIMTRRQLKTFGRVDCSSVTRRLKKFCSRYQIVGDD